MAGLMNLGRGTANSAMRDLGTGADAEHQRNIAQEQINQAQDAAKKSTMGTMAGAGAQLGMSDMGGEFIANTFGGGGTFDVAAKMGVDSVGLGTAGTNVASMANLGAEQAGMLAAQNTGLGAEAAVMTDAALATEAASGAAVGAEAGMMAGPVGAAIGWAAG